MNVRTDRLSFRLAAAIAGILGATATTLHAAEEPPASGGLEEVVVSGTRIQTSGYDAPTPVSVLSSVDIAQSGTATLSDYMNQQPELAGSRTPRTTKGGIGNGYSGGNFLNLRNLGPMRTLVLLDGKRFTPSTLDGYVDLNNLPTPLISRVEIVTGGASATWGSDAVAGVANFVLDKEYEGIKGSVNFGTSIEGDGDNTAVDLSFGTKFADGRGHLLLSGQYNDSSRVVQSDRSWFKARKVVTNPNAAQAGQPALLFEPWSSNTTAEGGIVVTGPLAGYYMNSDGTFGGTNFPLNNRSGSFYYGDKSIYDRLYDPAPGNFLSVPVETATGFGRLAFDFTDNLTAYAEVSYGKTDTNATVAAYNRPNNLVIQRDNFYLPANIGAAMDANALTTLTFGTAYPNLGTINSTNSRENLRILGGLEGKFAEAWKWDVSYQYGRADTLNAAKDMPRVNPYFNLATDAVANPGNPSQPICRSTLTNPNDGCVPLSPFDTRTASAEQLAYLSGTSKQDIRYEQSVAAANLSGELYQMPAGPLSLATGVEYREEKAHAVADPVSLVNGFWAGNFKNFDGKYHVSEVYAELAVPVLDQSAVGSLDVNLAGRYTDYSTSGAVDTWKVGFVYTPVESVRVRVTRSRDIRAPNLQELYSPGVVATQLINDPEMPPESSSYRMTQTASGNLELDPEKADTWVAGIVVQPTFLEGLRASIDYYDIKIKDAIATNSSQFIIDRCYEGLTEFCDAIVRNPNSTPVPNMITAVNLKPFNAVEEEAKGYDFAVSYARPLAGGDLGLDWSATYVDTLDIKTLTTTITRAGEAGNNAGAAEGTPEWRWTATATYGLDPWTMQLKGRYIGSAKVDDAWDHVLVGGVEHPGINHNSVPSVFYLDAYVSYRLDNLFESIKGGEVYLAAENILNKDPPNVPLQDTANTVGSGTNPFIYDVVGTTLRVGVRFDF